MATFEVSSVCSAFKLDTIGTKVTDPAWFRAHLAEAVEAHDASKDRVPGQMFVVLPSKAYSTVSAGEGKASPDASRYVARSHRGKVGAYLRREFAEPVRFLAVTVYTRDAYNADPDVIRDGRTTAADYMIVAVLGCAAPEAPLSPDRFVANLAGGNREALLWTAEETRAKASAIAAYWSEWAIVAD
jgi:hypothetical protein